MLKSSDAARRPVYYLSQTTNFCRRLLVGLHPALLHLQLSLRLSLSHLHLGPDLLHSLIDVAFRVLGNTENGLPARQTVCADAPDESRARPALALLKSLLEGNLTGGGKEGERGKGPDNSVEPEAGPGGNGALEREDQEGGGGKGKGQLGNEIGSKVVVLLLGRRVVVDGIQEEWPNLTTEV